jgi:ribosome-associated translation inhibitor RaiA
MIIQLNAGKNLNVHETFAAKLNSLLSGELNRFSEHITRIEVHLSDEDGSKKGTEDKRCLLEARLAGRQPIAVTGFADNYELAVNNAVEKLKNSLNTIVGRSRRH